ncbi:MAG TPA: nitrate reductase associated protein, partial [Polyangium sp.]|nr:nitrate reductase associated protein [Polyangium sp.]
MEHVFPFELDQIGPDLDLMPLAARRALDHAGLHLPLEGWRSLNVDERKRLIHVGAQREVDAAAVAILIGHAKPPARPVDPVFDPVAEYLPLGLSAKRGVDVERWRTLTGLERYVLAHAAQNAVKRGKPRL